MYICIYIYIFFFFLEDINYSHCIHNWPVMREISNVFKFRRVGPACWWHDTLRNCSVFARLFAQPYSWPVQRSSEFSGSDFKVSPLPPSPLAVDDACPYYSGCLWSWQPPRPCPPPPLLSHKLVSRVGMQWEYYAIVVTLKYEVK